MFSDIKKGRDTFQGSVRFASKMAKCGFKGKI